MNRIVNLQTDTTTNVGGFASTVCPVNVSERKAQIKAIVDKKINALIKQHEEEISGKTSEFTKNWFGKEFTLEEYKEMIAKSEEALHKIPPEYSTPEMRIAYQNTVEKEIEYIKQDMQRMLDFKDYLRREERRIYEEYPLNIYQLIDNVKRYIKNRILYYQKEITTEYYESFKDKVMKLYPKDGKDYSRTVSLIFRTKTSKKSMDVIYNFFEMLENKLNVAVSMFGNYNGNEYGKLQQLLKSIVEKTIEHFYFVITDFLIEYINCIDDGEMTDSQTVRTYAEYCIREMNAALLKDLPDILNNAMYEKFEDMIETLKYRSNELLGFNVSKIEDKAHTREAESSPSITYSEESSDVEVVITKPKRDFNDFLKTIGNEAIVADDLVRLYNNYFGVNVNIESLSKKAEFKEHFNVKRVMRSGKKVRVYVKI